jgi:hypothetical protein
MTNSSDAGRIGAELGEYAVSVSPGYAELHIRLPRGFEELQSGTTTIIDALAQNGVYAVDAFFASTDVGLFVREEEASRAFEVLRALIR